ncbi:MAG TPA: hypothetical protein VIJ14_08435 [Rhabdochlamydiaceae bacterium]
MMVVIGWIRASRQDLRRGVGIKSNVQVALEEDRMVARTSASVAGKKEDRIGGGESGVEWRGMEETVEGNAEQSWVTLSLKNWRKEAAR